MKKYEFLLIRFPISVDLIKYLSSKYTMKILRNQVQIRINPNISYRIKFDGKVKYKIPKAMQTIPRTIFNLLVILNINSLLIGKHLLIS